MDSTRGSGRRWQAILCSSREGESRSDSLLRGLGRCEGMHEYDRFPCPGGRTRRWRAVLLLGCLPTALSACGTIPDLPTGAAPPTATVEESGEIKYYPSDEPLHTGMEYFT